MKAPPIDSGVTSGRLSGNQCEVTENALIARCAIGRGRATVVADADFLNSDNSRLDLLIEELARLESR